MSKLIGKIKIFDHSITDGETVMNEEETLMAVAVARRINQSWTTTATRAQPQRTIMIGDVAVFTVVHDQDGNPVQGEPVLNTQTWSVNNVRHVDGDKIINQMIIRSPFDRQDTSRGNQVNVNLSRYIGDGVKELCAKAMTKAALILKESKGINSQIPEQYKELTKIAIDMAKSLQAATESDDGYTNPLAQSIVNSDAFADIMNNGTKE